MSSKTTNPEAHEPHPDPQKLTYNKADPSKNCSANVDYEPHPESSIPLTPERQKIVNAITALYSGGASEEDMQVYAEKSIYDDPWSYCDTRYKIAGQWYGTSSDFPHLAIFCLAQMSSFSLWHLQESQ